LGSFVFGFGLCISFACSKECCGDKREHIFFGTIGKTEDFAKASDEFLSERVVIENFHISSDGYCMIFIRNIGKTHVSISKIEITLSNGDVYIYNSGDFSSTPKIGLPGELVIIEDIQTTYLPGNYIVKVITQRSVSTILETLMD
jgi:hypothetical protein